MIFHCTTTKECKVVWTVCVYNTEIVVERSNSPNHDEDLGASIPRITKKVKGK